MTKRKKIEVEDNVFQHRVESEKCTVLLIPMRVFNHLSSIMQKLKEVNLGLTMIPESSLRWGPDMGYYYYYCHTVLGSASIYIYW